MAHPAARRADPRHASDRGHPPPAAPQRAEAWGTAWNPRATSRSGSANVTFLAGSPEHFADGAARRVVDRCGSARTPDHRSITIHHRRPAPPL